jgi:hypothetical protein
MSAKRHDYRIIARARAPIIEWRQRWRTARRPAPTRAHAHAMQARSGARAPAPIPALPLFSAYFRGSMQSSARKSSYSRNCSQAPLTVRRAMRLAAAGVSNRNGARTHRNRIFLHRRHHIFVVGTLQTRATALETRRESSDSAQVIRFGVRRRAAFSTPRSPLADWLCRRSTSSPDPRTSPTSRASIWPVPPSPDWPR